MELVLGPEISRPEFQRVLALVRHRTGRRPVHIDYEGPSSDEATLITRHPLWAEDFIGDYFRRTESGTT